MKKLIILIAIFAYSGITIAQVEKNQNGSPYFLVQNENGNVEQFSLQGTKIEANISGFVADVTVSQTYINKSDTPIEAVYVFPASTRSAVYSMHMRIGDRIIEAKIKEKTKARQEYNLAKAEGKRASLLEQLNPNVFQMNVANIMPGDQIQVTFKYNEFLIPENGEYAFIYPTVVGPRFAKDGQAPSYVANPYLKEGSDNPYNFDISINLSSPVNISSAICNSHKNIMNFISGTELKMSLDGKEKNGGNRDFIFNYRIAEGKIATGTMLYEHDDENFFLSIIQPPKNISQEDISPREYIFIVDVSGSMHGYPLEVSKEMMRNLLSSLRPIDKFNVMLFASSSMVLSQMSLAANESNIQKAFGLMSNQRGGGGTYLLEAVKRAMQLPKESDDFARSFVILTDGYVSVEKETFNYIENNLNKANFFAFGIGTSVNRFIIEGIAHQGRAEPFVVTEQKYAKATANKFKQYIESPILTNINMTFEGIDVYDTYPKQLPDLMAERPLYVFGKYKGNPDGKLVINGNQGQKEYNSELDFSKALFGCENSSIRYLWAREKLRQLSDFNAVSHENFGEEDIVELGLKYNLLTKYTSFLAVDHTEVVNKDGSIKTVKVPQPLPQGVSNYAIGFEMGAEQVELESTDIVLEELFVVIQNNKDISNYVKIEKWLQQQFAYCDKEAKSLLQNKKLTLVKSESGHYVLVHADAYLTSEQIQTFNKQLLGLDMICSDDTLKISMVWL